MESSELDSVTSCVQLKSGLLISPGQLPKRPGVIIYESAARPTDHKVETVSSSQAWRPGY